MLAIDGSPVPGLKEFLGSPQILAVCCTMRAEKNGQGKRKSKELPQRGGNDGDFLLSSSLLSAACSAHAGTLPKDAVSALISHSRILTLGSDAAIRSRHPASVSQRQGGIDSSRVSAPPPLTRVAGPTLGGKKKILGRQRPPPCSTSFETRVLKFLTCFPGFDDRQPQDGAPQKISQLSTPQDGSQSPDNIARSFDDA